MKSHIYVIVTLGACAYRQGSEPIAVGENELGVTAIHVEQFDSNGDRIFELRGVDAADNELALVHVRTGAIEDLTHFTSRDTKLGSEIILSTAGGESKRWVTEETRFIEFLPEGAAMKVFVALPEVRAAFGQANVRAGSVTASVDEAAYAFEPYSYDCPSYYLLDQNRQSIYGQTDQCCYNTTYGGYTYFVLPNTYQTSLRFQGPPCTDPNGNYGCQGDQCYYGPNGFARAYLADNPYYVKVRTGYDGATWLCNRYYDFDGPEFGTVFGTADHNAQCDGSPKSYPTPWSY